VGSYYVFRNPKAYVSFLARLIAKWLFRGSEVICNLSYLVKIWREVFGSSIKVFFIAPGIPEEVFKVSCSMGEYIFTGGYSNRDFSTLISAIYDLPINLVLVTSRHVFREIKEYNQIKVFYDLPIDHFRALLSKSLLVIIPLRGFLPPSGATVVLEAMAMGKAVIATKNAGTVDFIVDGENGFLVEPGDVKTLREKIMFLLNNLNGVQRIGYNARESAKNYHEKLIADKFFEIALKCKE
jgi:glycosyltransferase involved in cell wall biosynthesis